MCVLLLPVAGAGSIHTLLDAALGDEAFLQLLYVCVHHLVGLMTEGEEKVGHLLVVHLRHKRLVGAVIVMVVTEIAQATLAFAVGCPSGEVVGVEVVLIV